MTDLGIQDGRRAPARPGQVKAFGRSIQDKMQYARRFRLFGRDRNKRHGHDKEGRCRNNASRTVSIVRVTRAVSRCMSVTVSHLLFTDGDTGSGRNVMDMMMGEHALQGKGADKQPRDHELVPAVPRCS